MGSPAVGGHCPPGSVRRRTQRGLEQVFLLPAAVCKALWLPPAAFLLGYKCTLCATVSGKCLLAATQAPSSDGTSHQGGLQQSK